MKSEKENPILAGPGLTFGQLLRAYRGRLLWGSILLAFTNALILVVPRLIKHVVDSLEQGSIEGRGILFLALAIAAVALSQGLIRTGSRLCILGVSRRTVADLRTRVFAHLESLPMGFFRETPTGDILSRAINDTRQIRSLMGPGVLNAINTSLIYVGALSILLYMDWRLTLLALTPYPFLLIAVHRLAAGIHRHSTEVQERLSDVSSKIQENLNGIQVVKSYTREPQEIESFRGHTREYFNANRRLIRVRSLLIPLMGAMGGVGTLMVLWLGGRRVVDGSFSLGDFIAFNAYLGYLVWPTIAMGWVLNVFQRGFASLARLRQLLSRPGEVARGQEFEPLGETRGELEFRNLTYAHEGGGGGIEGITAKIPAGSTLGIVGRIGSGKTTLLDALARLVPIKEGMVFLDSRDVTTIDPRELRRALGFVPQDPFLFSTTLEENLGYGLEVRDELARARVREAASIAQLAADLEDFPEGYETLIGERGITLSGGQRQRATLARAVAVQPAVLILDDVLSAVDADTEEAILGRLEEVRKEQTTLIVSHRVSAVQAADEILVLEEGRVRERGTHEALVKAGGFYAKLYRRQALEKELEQA